MFIGRNLDEAMVKSILQVRKTIDMNSALISVCEQDKPQILNIARNLQFAGFQIYATPGTCSFLKKNGIASEVVYKIEDVRTPRVDRLIREKRVGIVINTPENRSGSLKDGNEIRRLSIRSNRLLATNIRLAEAIVSALIKKEKVSYREVSEYARKE